MTNTHETRLLWYLENHKNSITSLEAINDLGNTRLAATVCTLRKKGYEISSKTVEVPTRFIGKAKVSEYRLDTAFGYALEQI
jgi:hypothetical protein